MFPGLSFRIENLWILLTLAGVVLLCGALIYPRESEATYIRKDGQLEGDMSRLRVEYEELSANERNNFAFLHDFGRDLLHRLYDDSGNRREAPLDIPKEVQDQIDLHEKIENECNETRTKLVGRIRDLNATRNAIRADRDIANRDRGLALLGNVLGCLMTVVGGYYWYTTHKRDENGDSRSTNYFGVSIASLGLVLVGLSIFVPQYQAYRIEVKNIQSSAQANEVIIRMRKYVPDPIDFELGMIKDHNSRFVDRDEEAIRDTIDKVGRDLESRGPSAADDAAHFRALIDIRRDIATSAYWADITNRLSNWSLVIGIAIALAGLYVCYSGISISLRRAP